jgi:hypothetical protein
MCLFGRYILLGGWHERAELRVTRERIDSSRSGQQKRHCGDSGAVIVLTQPFAAIPWDAHGQLARRMRIFFKPR